jgi:hypothetical protein
MILELWCISGGRQMPSEKFRPLSRSSYVMAFANYLIMSRLYNVQAHFPFLGRINIPNRSRDPD